MLFTECFEERGVGPREHFLDPIHSPSFHHRGGLPEKDGGRLVRPERTERDTSRVEVPTPECIVTEFVGLFGGVDGRSEGCSPVTTSRRDPRLALRCVRGAHAVTGPGADLDGFVEQGERALRLLEREPKRMDREDERERTVDAGGPGEMHRFVNGRDRGVGRRFGDLERGAEREQRVG